MSDFLFEDTGADREKIVLLVDKLRRCFEEHINAVAARGKEHEMSYIDALLAAHNFHKLIVLDVEERAAIKERARQVYRQSWADTFAISLLGTEEQKEAMKAKNQS